MSDPKLTPNDKLIKYLTEYLQLSSYSHYNDELEARFGIKKSITQIQFDSVMAKLKSLGFEAESLQGKYHLNI